MSLSTVRLLNNRLKYQMKKTALSELMQEPSSCLTTCCTLCHTYIMAETRIRNLPDDVWRRFRVICLEAGISANKRLIQLIEAEVKRVDKAEAKKK